MSDIFNEKDLVTMNDKVLDLKYEKKLEKYERKLKKIVVLKDVLRILTIGIADSAPIAIGGTSLALLISSAISGGLNVAALLIMLFSLLCSVPYYMILDSIDEHIPTEDGENFFTHPHFDYLIEHIQDVHKSKKEIKLISKKMNLAKKTAADIVLSPEEEERLKIRTKRELMKYINDGNIENQSDGKTDDYIMANYIKSNKSRADDLNYLRKRLLEYKKIEKEETLESDKIYVKQMYKN